MAGVPDSAQCHDHLARVCGMLREHGVVPELEPGDVRGDARVESGGHPRGQVAPLGRGGEERGAVLRRTVTA